MIEEYSNRFYKTFAIENKGFYYRNDEKTEIKKIKGMKSIVWKLIYPMNKEEDGLDARPPVCFHRSIRHRDPKEFTRRFFGKAPKSLVKAVIEHIPFDKHSINSLFLARCFYGIWPIDKVVSFLNLAKKCPQRPFIFGNNGPAPFGAEDYRKIDIWTNFFRKFSSRKIINWYNKYPKEFGVYTKDTINQLEEIRQHQIKVRLSKKMDIKKIHDVISKLYRQLEKAEYALPVYEELYELNNKKVLGHDLVFPKTNHDLVDWGVELNNCVGSYDYSVKSGRSIIFSLQKDGKPVYCVEFSFFANMKNMRMIQCKGMHNSDAPEEIQKECKKIVESASNPDTMEGKMKLIVPEEHKLKVKDITKDIDLDALGNIEAAPAVPDNAVVALEHAQGAW